jgi:hypothetical protein
MLTRCCVGGWLTEELDGTGDQLIVPKDLRRPILDFAHSVVPLAGHLGMDNTRDRIVQHYYMARVVW